MHLQIPTSAALRTTVQPLFLPLAVSLIENAAPQKSTWNGNELVLDLRISEQYVKPAAILPGVLVIGGRGYTIYPVLHARQSTKPQ